MNGVVIEFDIEAATAIVASAWEDVFTTSDIIIRQSGLYGFNEIGLIPNPNIHQLLASMGVVSIMLDKISEKLSCINLGHDETRKLFNAKQQILKLEQVASALLAKDEPLYNQAMLELKKQAVF
jgi:hypothetical protein